jgi:putative addiction module component (TIGR02574 family)
MISPIRYTRFAFKKETAMQFSYGKIATAALELPFKGRAKLVEKLLRSLDGPKEEEISELWAEEAEGRYSEYKAGKTKLIDGEAAIKRLKVRNK